MRYALFARILVPASIGLLSGQGQAASPAGRCPIDRVAGHITKIDGPKDKVTLLREGKSVSVENGMCILYGDDLEALHETSVTVSRLPEASLGDSLNLGRFQPQSVWKVPDSAEPPAPPWIDIIQKAFQGFLDHPAPVYGVARGGSECASASQPTARQPLIALKSMPVGAQKLGADVRVVLAAWGSNLPEIRVRLIKDDGSVLVEQRVCWKTSAELALPNNAIRRGQHLTLDIRDSSGEGLAYPIEIVSPNELPMPSPPPHNPWLLAAWRLASGVPSVRLDAISRLSEVSNQSYAAKQILSGTLLDGAT